MTISVNYQSLLTRDEAAEYLSLKPQTLAAWAMTGKGPPLVKLGRAVRYRFADLEAYVRSQTVGCVPSR